MVQETDARGVWRRASSVPSAACERASATARRGAAAVEFAVIAPMFLLLLAGIIEFGQAFRIEHALANAARRGARSACVDGATTAQVSTTVKNHLVQTLSVAAGDVTVEVKVNDKVADASTAEEHDAVGVTVSVPFTKAGVSFFAQRFLGATLSATQILEHE